MNFDFMSAKLKHSMWKLHLRDFLDGKPGLSEAQAVDDRACDLGAWLHGEALNKYGSVPGMKELDSEHRGLHGLVRQVIEHKRAGRKAQAEAALASVDASSKRVVALLGSIEKQVGSAGVSG